MGMSMHIIGFRPPDERWRKMKAVSDACEQVGIAPPKEVSQFFGGEAPDERGVEFDIPFSDWSDNFRQGFEIEVAKIPKDCTTIRFYTSW